MNIHRRRVTDGHSLMSSADEDNNVHDDDDDDTTGYTDDPGDEDSVSPRATQRRNHGGHIQRTFSSDDAEGFDMGVQRSRSRLGLTLRARNRGRSNSNESIDRLSRIDGTERRGGSRRLKKKNSGSAGTGLGASFHTGVPSPRHGGASWIKSAWVRMTAVTVVVVYLAVVAYMMKTATDGNSAASSYGGPSSPDFLPLLSITALERHVTDQDETKARQAFRLEQRDARFGRKYRTTPAKDGPASASIASHAVYHTVDRHARDPHPRAIGKEPRDAMRPARMDELCGFFAQNASATHPEQYVFRDALNEHSRVIITGILNPIGFHLALALEQRCGANVITGFDAAFPNSVKNRLAIQDEIGILTSKVTSMERPIINSFLGLDPKVKNPVWPSLAVTGELDIAKWRPTHIVHLSSYAPEVFRNQDAEWRNDQSPYVRDDYDPRLYALRNNLVPMEQLMATTALVANKPLQPHLTYASSNLIHRNTVTKSRDDTWQAHVALMNEVLADTYYQTHGTFSVALRLPNAVYGPRGHTESDIHRMVNRALRHETHDVNATVTWTSNDLDMVHMDDVVDSIIAAMQFRESKPVAFEITSGQSIPRESVEEAIEGILAGNTKVKLAKSAQPVDDPARDLTRTFLGWKPKVSPEKGLVRTVAWHMDKATPYGPPPHKSRRGTTGDDLLKSHSIDTCRAADTVCNSNRDTLLCASECNIKDKCVPSIFDKIVSLAREVTEDCEIVLYTQMLGRNVEDIRLQAHYNENDEPSICNFAFVSSGSKLVDSVIRKVPSTELVRLGVVPNPDDADKPGGTRALELRKLNGRLLYRGWILLWVEDAPFPLPNSDSFLLKLAPGRFFSRDVKFAMYLDPSFPAMPTAEDVGFLVSQMHRRSWEQRTVKRKTRPKAKFRLPPEPERKAVMLVPQLKYQASKDDEPFSSDTVVPLTQAVKFMRFEKGENPDSAESEMLQIYREFLLRVQTFTNRGDFLKSPNEPVYFFEMHHWARTQWIMHDLHLGEAKDLRCDWYQETVQWEMNLDQLSFAHVMERRELERRMAHKEVDDIQMRIYNEKRDMLRLLSDAHEWHPLQTEQNKLCPTNFDLEAMPYDKSHSIARLPTQTLPPELDHVPTPLFARIISDRIMALSRKGWNKERKAHRAAAAAAHHHGNKKI
jgi:nucleoside-diphosphate-sugar epimerase